MREEALHDRAPLLGVDLLGELHRALHVGEQHRHLLALALRRRRRGRRRPRGRQRPAAAVAEPLPGRVRGVARGAGRSWSRARFRNRRRTVPPQDSRYRTSGRSSSLASGFERSSACGPALSTQRHRTGCTQRAGPWRSHEAAPAAGYGPPGPWGVPASGREGQATPAGGRRCAATYVRTGRAASMPRPMPSGIVRPSRTNATGKPLSVSVRSASGVAGAAWLRLARYCCWLSSSLWAMSCRGRRLRPVRPGGGGVGGRAGGGRRRGDREDRGGDDEEAGGLHAEDPPAGALQTRNGAVTALVGSRRSGLPHPRSAGGLARRARDPCGGRAPARATGAAAAGGRPRRLDRPPDGRAVGRAAARRRVDRAARARLAAAQGAARGRRDPSSRALPATRCSCPATGSTCGASSVASTRASGCWRARSRPRGRALERALGEWRGAPLTDVAYAPFAQAAIVRLEELRASALELRIEAELALGRHARLIGELQELVGAPPAARAAVGQLMPRALPRRPPGRRAGRLPLRARAA